MKSKRKLKAYRSLDNRGFLEGDIRPAGRLIVDFSKDSTEATKILLEAGFRIVTLPVSGTSEPELSIGADAYHGLKEIRQIVKKYKR